MLLAWLVRLTAAGACAAAIGSVPAGSYGGDALLTLFSPDGYHYAYLAAVKGREVWFKDGRKADSAPKEGFAYAYKDRKLAISAALGKGGTLAYARRVYADDGRPLGLAVTVNGRAGPRYDSITLLTVSEDGRHVGYAARDSRWHVVVDGNGVADLEYAPGALAVNDGGHAAYLAPDPQGGGHSALFLDGKRLRSWPYADLYFSLDWKRVAGTTGELSDKVGVDGEKEYGPYGGIQAPILFSPDGRRFAYAAEEGRDHLVFIDGKAAGPALAFFPNRLAFGSDQRLYWLGKTSGGEPHKLFIDGDAVGAWKTAVDFAVSAEGGALRGLRLA